MPRTEYNAALRERYHVTLRLGFSHTAAALADMLADDERRSGAWFEATAAAPSCEDAVPPPGRAS